MKVKLPDAIEAYYNQLLTATTPESEAGPQVTAKEFEAAKAQLAGLKGDSAQGALLDTAQYFAFMAEHGGEQAPRLDPAVKSLLDATVQAGGPRLRAANLLARQAFLAAQDPEAFEGYPALQTANQVEAFKHGLEVAISQQAGAGEGRDQLLALVGQLTEGVQLMEVVKLWPRLRTGDGLIDLERVAYLAQVLSYELKHSTEARQATLSKAIAQIVTKDEGGEVGPTREPPATIGGRPVAEVGDEIERLAKQQGVGAMLLDPDRMRVAAYRQAVAAMREHPLVRRVMPAIERLALREENEMLAAQAMRPGLVLDRPDAAGRKIPINNAAYELVQDVGQRMGFTDPISVVIEPDLLPNAYIYTSDPKRARVTLMTPLLEKLWDSQRGDWLSIHLDAQGQPCEASAPGAREYPLGRLMVESVVAHELGHIRDQVVLNEVLLLVVMQSLGVDLLKGERKDDKKGDPAAVPATVQARWQSRAILQRPDLPVLTKGEAAEVLRAVVPQLSNLLEVEAKGGAGRSMASEFGLRYMLFSRAAESTADRYPVALQGDPLPTQLTDLMLNTDYSIGSDTDKRRRLEDLLRIGPETWAHQKLEQSASLSDDDAFSARAGSSHPHGPVRILDAGSYTREDAYYQALVELQGLPPGERLLGLMQLYERSIDRREVALETIKPHDDWDSEANLRKEARLATEIKQIEGSLAPLMRYFTELVRADGLAAPAGAYVDQALAFIARGGSEVTKDIAKVDEDSVALRTAPFRRVLQALDELLATEEARGDLDAGAKGRVAKRREVVAKLQGSIGEQDQARRKRDDLRRQVMSHIATRNSI